MTGLLASQNSLDPRNNFVGTRVTRFVEINYAAADVTFEVPFQWSAAIRNWGKVTSPNKKVIVIFKQQTLNPRKCQYIRHTRKGTME